MVKKKLTTESLGRDGEDCPGMLPARETKITRRWRGIHAWCVKDGGRVLPKVFSVTHSASAWSVGVRPSCRRCIALFAAIGQKQREVIRYFVSQSHNLKMFLLDKALMCNEYFWQVKWLITPQRSWRQRCLQILKRLLVRASNKRDGSLLRRRVNLLS